MISPTGLLATALIAFAVLNTVTARTITGEEKTESLEAANTQQVVEQNRIFMSQSTSTTCDKNGKCNTKHCCNGKCKTYKNTKIGKVFRC